MQDSRDFEKKIKEIEEKIEQTKFYNKLDHKEK